MDPHWLWPEAGENLLELQHNFRSVRSKENGHPRQTHQQCARSCGTGLTPDAQIAFSRVKLRLAWRRTVALPRFTGNRQSVDVKQGLRFTVSLLFAVDTEVRWGFYCPPQSWRGHCHSTSLCYNRPFPLLSVGHQMFKTKGKLKCTLKTQFIIMRCSFTQLLFLMTSSFQCFVFCFFFSFIPVVYKSSQFYFDSTISQITHMPQTLKKSLHSRESRPRWYFIIHVRLLVGLSAGLRKLSTLTAEPEKTSRLETS